MDQKNTENFQIQLEQNSVKTYLKRLQNNDAIFDEARYPTGFPELDKALAGGLVAGLHCIGAISSLGKTTFVLQMGENIANTGTPVILFSLEMRPEQLVAKTVSKNMYLAALERVDSENIDIYHHAKGYSELMSARNRSAFTKQEQGIYEDSIKQSSSDMLIVSETADGKPFCIHQIVDYINTYIAVTKKKPVVIIDYLQFIRPGNQITGTDKQIMDNIVSSLVFTAKILRIPIVAISSLNRGGYDSPVTMASFKESGFIEYSCETMLGLQLKGVGEKDFDVLMARAKNPREVELVLIKGRGIEVGAVIDYRFYGRHNYFEEIGRSNRTQAYSQGIQETQTERKRVR